MRFVLHINLENEAMQSYADISRALERLVAKFARVDDPPMSTDGNKIMDVNGNSVGRWEVKGPYDDKDE